MNGKVCASECETVTLRQGLGAKPEQAAYLTKYRILEWEQDKQRRLVSRWAYKFFCYRLRGVT
jgi:hypothetical protein